MDTEDSSRFLLLTNGCASLVSGAAIDENNLMSSCTIQGQRKTCF